MSALVRCLARLLPAALAQKLGASTWGTKPEPSPEHLKAENLRLWVQSGAQCWPGDLVPGSSDFLVPEFTLRAPHPEALPPGQNTLGLVLVRDGRQWPICRQPLNWPGGTLNVRGPAVPVQNRRLFPHPGLYWLSASVANREVSRFRFRLLGEQEVGHQMKVARVNIQAEKRSGQIVSGLRVLRWEEHLAILPSLQIETGIPAPNSLVRCAVHTLQGTALVGCEEFVLPLDRPGRLVRLRRIELGVAGFRARPKPTRFTFAVYVAGDLKAVTPFLLLPADHISNAEGQLTQDAKDLPLDDLEYEQIMNSLALPIPPLARRSLWR